MVDRPREVFVISDLHIGGPEGFQMMRRPQALAAFIQTRAASASSCELVIAGDFVDFLAEGTAPEGEVPDQWDPLITDPDVATWMLERIMQRDGFGAIFDALAGFVAAGHWLTILLGNHDIELSYPTVRKALCKRLGVQEGFGLRFVYDGEAYRVGDALIEHGNRYDRWNQVNQDGLRALRSLMSRDQEMAHETVLPAPAGSRLVAQVMNPVKRDYGFVDLLKPEGDAVLPILLALEPAYLGRVKDAVRALSPGVAHGVGPTAVPIRMSDASAGGGGISMGFDGPAQATVDSILGDVLGEDAATFRDAIQTEPEIGIRDASALQEGLRIAGSLLGILRAGDSLQDRLPALGRALQALENARDWDLDYEPEGSVYFKAADAVARATECKVIVFGHTHHARDLDLPCGARYLNTGTWAELAKVPDDIVEAGSNALDALETFVAKLDANELDGLTWFRPTYARLVLDDAGNVAEAGVFEAELG